MIITSNGRLSFCLEVVSVGIVDVNSERATGILDVRGGGGKYTRGIEKQSDARERLFKCNRGQSVQDYLETGAG